MMEGIIIGRCKKVKETEAGPKVALLILRKMGSKMGSNGAKSTIDPKWGQMEMGSSLLLTHVR